MARVSRAQRPPTLRAHPRLLRLAPPRRSAPQAALLVRVRVGVRVRIRVTVKVRVEVRVRVRVRVRFG